MSIVRSFSSNDAAKDLKGTSRFAAYAAAQAGVVAYVAAHEQISFPYLVKTKIHSLETMKSLLWLRR